MSGAKTIGVGVIGVGAIGRIHAEHLASRVFGARLAAIADTNATVADTEADRFGVTAYSDHESLLADPNVDAVAICTLRDMHAPLIIAAAAAGKHIFCEKPLAGSLEEIDDAIAAVEKAGVVLQVGFQRRFDAGFREVRDAITAGRIGESRIIHSISRDPAWGGNASRMPEDLLLETTIHDIDMVRHLSGSEIVSVGAAGIPAAEQGRLEGAILTLSLANGVVATIDNHVGSAYGYDQRVEVFGTKGVASVANVSTHTATLISESGAASAPPRNFFADRYADAYVAELAAFADCVTNGTPPPVTAADGRAAVVAALAALDSLADQGWGPDPQRT